MGEASQSLNLGAELVMELTGNELFVSFEVGKYWENLPPLMSLCIGNNPFEVCGRFSVHKWWIFCYAGVGKCCDIRTRVCVRSCDWLVFVLSNAQYAISLMCEWLLQTH